MKTNIQKYPAYKDSGAEWLGDLPIHWESIKMKHLFQDVSIKKKADAELLSVTQDQGVVPRTWVENRMVMPSGALESFKFINKGDFAISLRSFEGGLEYCHHDGIISPAYTVLKAKRTFESQFYKYLFKSFSFISELQTSVVGIRQGKNISFEELSYSYLPIPPLPEQTAIAAFLDHKTALIDQAIGIKQKQIELLKERRQILIHKAVTRGLNPNVKLKDSGVEWIGEIPEHWEVRRIKTLTRVKRGASPRPIDDPRYFNDNGEFAWVRIADVSSNDHYLINTVQKLSKLGSSLSVKILPNELFISIAGTVGKPMISKIKCCIHDGFVYFPDLKMNLEYMYRIFETGQPYLGLGKHGTQLNLNTETIGNIYIPLPPANIQNEIVCEVNNISMKFATAISLKEQEIEKLKEYKATLINSAVTGKIKVC